MNRCGVRIFSIVYIALAVTLFVDSYAAAEDKVTYRLKWLINMSTVGDVFAKDQGYFKKQGLDVTIKPGGPERDAIRELELGYANFGVASADQVIQAVAKGAPVMVIAQLFQANPLQWIYFKKENNLQSLSDLKGKTLGVTFGKNDEFIMRTLLTKAKLSEDQVRLYSVRLDFSPFYKHEVDFWPVYINTQGIEIGRRLKTAGEQFGFLNPTQFGVRFVANSVVTSAQMAKRHPDIIKRFLVALIQGWQAAIDPDNSNTAISTVKRYDRTASKDVLQEQLAQTRELIKPAAGKSVGFIDVSAWQQTEQIMLDNKQIEGPVNVKQYLRIR